MALERLQAGEEEKLKSMLVVGGLPALTVVLHLQTWLSKAMFVKDTNCGRTRYNTAEAANK